MKDPDHCVCIWCGHVKSKHDHHPKEWPPMLAGYPVNLYDCKEFKSCGTLTNPVERSNRLRNQAVQAESAELEDRRPLVRLR